MGFFKLSTHYLIKLSMNSTILIRIKYILILSIFTLTCLARNRIEDSTINYFLKTQLKDKDKPKADNKVEGLIPKASSDSLYKVIFGSLPKSTLSYSEDKESNKRNKKGRFSFEMTDKVKTKSAFY